MAKIVTASQQFALQQKIARKSIREFQPKILTALQSDFDKAAKLVKDYGVQQTINNRNALFDGKNINNILRTLYLTTGGYTAMRYEKIFDKYKKEESVDLDPLNIIDEWLAFMLSYWTTYSGTKMYGIENTTKNEITRIKIENMAAPKKILIDSNKTLSDAHLIFINKNNIRRLNKKNYLDPLLYETYPYPPNYDEMSEDEIWLHWMIGDGRCA
jgi:hypothetical protein